jgi:pimeloyl-ACP methyl ester carboxylesterase
MLHRVALVAAAVALLVPASFAARPAPAPSPFEDGYAEVNGVRLHYASVGKGPLVLFLHGYPSFWYQWKDQMLELGRDHRAVALDMRGYNLSSRPEGLEPYTMPHLVEDVRQFVDKVHGAGKKFTLVAHDWGANVAWVFAMYHPTSTVIDVPPFVVWGLRDSAILSGHLSGLEKWVPNLSVRLYPDGDHWVMLTHATAVGRDLRGFLTDSAFPKESVFRPTPK